MDVSAKKLAQMLAEKHDRFISEYSDEVDKIKQITMLTEKKDQLVHWVAENGGKDKFSKELDDTSRELSALSQSYKPKPQSYYAGLREHIEEHKKARDHWIAKAKEIKS
jgi:hypothetical protein